MWHKPCRTFNPWCLCIKTRCLSDYFCQFPFLNHSGWVAHICISKLTIIGADNGLWPGRHQAITWTNVGILLIRTLGTHFHSRKCICKCRPWNGISSQLYVYNSAHWDCCISHIPQVDFFTTVLLIRSIIVCIFFISQIRWSRYMKFFPIQGEYKSCWETCPNYCDLVVNPLRLNVITFGWM